MVSGASSSFLLTFTIFLVTGEYNSEIDFTDSTTQSSSPFLTSFPTSGSSTKTMSPCLNTGIAMGYVHPKHREKENILEIIIRNKPVKAKVVRPPIVPKDWAQQNQKMLKNF